MSKIWFISLFFLCLISFGTMSDNTVLANALANIATDLHATVSEMQFANIVFSLMAGSVMIAAGLLGGRLVWKKILNTGLLILIIAELIAYLTPNIQILVYMGRVLAGLGASLAIPAVIGLIPLLYDGKKLGLAFGMLGVTTALGSSVSPIISGLLIVHYGWRVCFLLLAILFLICIIGTTFSIKNLPKQINKHKFDSFGFILLFIGLTLFIYALSQISEWGLVNNINAPFTILGMSPILYMIFTGLIVMFLFWEYEKYRQNKYGAEAVLVPTIFISNHAILGGIAMSAYVFYCLGGLMFFIVLYMQIVLEQNAINTGIYLCVFSIGMSLSSIFAPVLGKNLSPKRLCQAGILVTSLAIILLSISISVTNITHLFFISLFIVGLGIGIVMSQASYAVSKAISDPNLVSHSGGVQGAARNIGQSIGVALVGLVLIFSLTNSVKKQLNTDQYLNNFVTTHLALNKEFNFISNKNLKQILQKENLSQSSINNAIIINQQSQIKSLRTTIMFIGISSLVFLFLTGGIISKRIKDLD
ncbi:MFS transporter [Rickettsiales bacterium LUAb2]